MYLTKVMTNEARAQRRAFLDRGTVRAVRPVKISGYGASPVVRAIPIGDREMIGRLHEKAMRELRAGNIAASISASRAAIDLDRKVGRR